MSSKMVGLVWDADLPRTEKYVLLALADHADHDGENIFPSNDRIAWKTGYKVDQIIVAIKRLKARKILVLVRAASRYSTNCYRMDPSKLPQRPPFARRQVQGSENPTPAKPPAPRVKRSQNPTPQGSENPTLTKNYTNQEQVPLSKLRFRKHNSDRPNESRTDGRRKPREATEEEQAAEELLIQNLGARAVDPYLARGIFADCRQENPEASPEAVMTRLAILLISGQWRGKHRPAGWIRSTMRELVRRDRLEAFEDRAAEGLEDMRRRRQETAGAAALPP
jgi:hypothetical protein